MERIETRTPDLTQENIDKLAELFPDAVTEVLDEEGNVVRAIDFDALRDDLSGEVAEGRRERYQFTWPGKARAKLEARTPTTKTMRPCPEKSVDWDATENIYIEGDNLEALKIMRETYAGKVKLIYIDPPYNTGHDFIYDDDFAETHAEYASESGEYDEEGGRLVANPESNGRFHSDWCSMMYPRLLLARDLLSQDGAIFISIGEEEQANLRKVLDEVYGASNRAAEFAVIRAEGGGLAKQVIKGHDYLFVYAKDITVFKPLGRPKDVRGRIVERNGRRYWIQTDWLRKKFGEYGNCHYEEVLEFKGQDQLNEIDAGLRDGKYVLVPQKNGMNLVGKLRDLATDSSKFYSVLTQKHLNKEGNSELQELGLLDWFDYPKPIELVRELIQGMTLGNPKEGALVLDFFSGSSTTAHAMLKQNALDGGTRKFICVQLPEAIESNSGELEFPTICDLGEERIRRAGAKIREEVEESNRQLRLGEEPKKLPDLGFRVLRVDDSCMNDTYGAPGEYQQQTLESLIDNLKDDVSPLDLLFEVLPKFRIPYSAKIDEREVGGCTVFDVNGGQLLACFDKDVSTEAIEAIAKEEPIYAVFRDASLADDSAAANLEELFKTFSPDTVRRVI